MDAFVEHVRRLLWGVHGNDRDRVGRHSRVHWPTPQARPGILALVKAALLQRAQLPVSHRLPVANVLYSGSMRRVGAYEVAAQNASVTGLTAAALDRGAAFRT